jgi:hypothetical protein
MRIPRLALASAVCAYLFMSLPQDTLAQCFPDPNGAGALCPATIPVPVCAPPLPPPALCPINTLGFTDQVTIDWVGPLGCAPVFDLVRGDVDCLRSSHAPVPATCVVAATSAGPSCLLPAAPVIEAAIPAFGEGYWYSVRVNPAFCGATTWNSTGVAQCTSYDPICFAIMGCPP